MSKKIKILIGFLLIVVLAEGWFIYMTFKVESRVIPGGIYHFHNGFAKTGVDYYDDYVSAEGTWISDTTLANPIQSSKISCLRDSMTCIESRGEISNDGYLMVDGYFFEIETWNEREIVTKPDDSAAGCTRYIMRFDRIQKQVTATRTTISNTGMCAGTEKKPMHLYLDDGLTAWRKLH